MSRTEEVAGGEEKVTAFPSHGRLRRISANLRFFQYSIQPDAEEDCDVEQCFAWFVFFIFQLACNVQKRMKAVYCTSTEGFLTTDNAFLEIIAKIWKLLC